MAGSSPPDDPDEIAQTLSLADWRRRVATLYAEVRSLAGTAPAAALERWRAVREELYREHPQSPLPPDQRAAFRARHFDHDPGLRFELTVEPPETSVSASPAAGSPIDVGRPIDFGGGGRQASGAIELPVSAGGAMSCRRFGAVTIPLPGGPRRLELYWIDGYAGGLFLPFRDATNGRETYGAGRYLLDAAKGADLGGDPAAGTITIDFNFAFQPSCAFDPKWACPLAPPANRLEAPIRAGERLA